MTNQNNLKLLETFQELHRLFFSFALKLCKTTEAAEDVMQQVALKLLKNPIAFEITSNKHFLFTMIKQANYNAYRTNKKYVYFNDSHTIGDDQTENAFADELMQSKVGCTYEGDLIDSFKFFEIEKAAQDLPKNQKHAIMNALAGNDVGEELGEVFASKNPRYESLKTNKRLAILKLKEKLA